MAICFPVYCDEATVRTVAERSLNVLSDITSRYKVIIVDDGSPDKSGQIADELAAEYPEIVSVHHKENLGYGAALQSGFKYALDYDWICFTDGDDEYPVGDLYHFSKLFHHYDMIITFRYTKIYGTTRIFVSFVYNFIIRWLFRSAFRDHNCGLKVIRSSVLKNIEIKSTSPFIGAEIIIKAMVKGYPIGEVGIMTYPRRFNQSHSTSIGNIIASFRDMLKVYREIFRRQAKTESKIRRDQRG